MPSTRSSPRGLSRINTTGRHRSSIIDSILTTGHYRNTRYYTGTDRLLRQRAQTGHDRNHRKAMIKKRSVPVLYSRKKLTGRYRRVA